MHDLDSSNAGVAHAGNARDRLPIRRHQAAYAAKFTQQRLGERFGVAARNGKGQQIFDKFMIVQRITAALRQLLPQPGAMTHAVMADHNIPVRQCLIIPRSEKMTYALRKYRARIFREPQTLCRRYGSSVKAGVGHKHGS